MRVEFVVTRHRIQYGAEVLRLRRQSARALLNIAIFTCMLMEALTVRPGQQADVIIEWPPYRVIPARDTRVDKAHCPP
jgi:hypothetical protein